MPKPIVFQKQREKFCAIHSYNNALQKRVLQYNLEEYLPTSRKTGKRIENLGSAQCGNYSPSIVAKAYNMKYKKTQSVKLSRFTKRSLSYGMLSKKLTVNNNQVLTNLIVILTQPHRHNVALVYGGKKWYLIDSELDRPKLIDREYFQYLVTDRGLQKSPTSVFTIVPSTYTMLPRQRETISLL